MCALLAACTTTDRTGKSLVALVAGSPCPPLSVKSPSHTALRNFAPVAAVWCQESEHNYPGDGQWSVMIKRQATHDLSALQSAFLQPDDPPYNGACASDLIVGPFIELVDASGKDALPAYPRDGCGQPKSAAISTVEHLTWQLVSTMKERQIVSQPALVADCPMQWKNELSYLTSSSKLAPAAQIFQRDSALLNLRICLYQTSAADRTVGNFMGAPHLDTAETAQLRSALSGAGRTGACPLQQQFAVIQQVGGAWVNVERGGCWRVARDDLQPTAIGRADPSATGELLR
jgi:hypothetical protein